MNNNENKDKKSQLNLGDKLHLLRHQVDLKILKAKQAIEDKMDAAKKKLSKFSLSVGEKMDAMERKMDEWEEKVRKFERKHNTKLVAGYLSAAVLLTGMGIVRCNQNSKQPAAIERQANDLVVNNVAPYVVREVADALELGIEERLNLAKRYNIEPSTLFLPMDTVPYAQKPVRIFTNHQYYQKEMQRRINAPMNPEIMPEKLEFNYNLNPDDNAYPLPEKVSYFQIKENNQPLPERGL